MAKLISLPGVDLKGENPKPPKSAVNAANPVLSAQGRSRDGAELERAVDADQHPGLKTAVDPDVAHGSQPAGRLFFPCNREDALLLLSGLCVSHFFPEHGVRLAVQGTGVALLEDGIRLEEELLLEGDRPQRFSVLIEVDLSVQHLEPRIIEFRHIVCLHFRDQGEADEFRLRPVEEFNPESIPFAVSPHLFSLEGEERFSIRPRADENLASLGFLADRLAAGVCNLLALGGVRPACRKAIARLLASDRLAAGECQGVALEDAIVGLLETGPAPSACRHAWGAVRTFAYAERTSGRQLVDAAGAHFKGQGEANESVLHQEDRWQAVAYDVMASRVVLDGGMLSDGGSVVLRGTLLGALCDDVEAIGVFLDAEPPAGPEVVATAAFLAGLKRGLLDLAWSSKAAMASSLSTLVATLLRRLVDPLPGKAVIACDVIETERHETLSVLCGEVILAEWLSLKPMTPDPISDWFRDELDKLGYLARCPDRERHALYAQLTPNHIVEVMLNRGGDRAFPTFLFRIDPAVKLKKAKEIGAANNRLGTLWRLVVDDNGGKALCCDLLGLPEGSAKEWLVEKFLEALSAVTVTKKGTASKRVRKKKGMPAESSSQ